MTENEFEKAAKVRTEIQKLEKLLDILGSRKVLIKNYDSPEYDTLPTEAISVLASNLLYKKLSLINEFKEL